MFKLFFLGVVVVVVIANTTNPKLAYLLISGSKKKVLAVPGEMINDADHPPIPVEQFAKHVAKLHKSDDRGYMIEYNVRTLVCPAVVAHLWSVWRPTESFVLLIHSSVG